MARRQKQGYVEPPQEGDMKLKKLIKPRSENQRHYFEALKKYTYVFGVGPAGTGKTYLAVAHALKLLKDNEITKVIITRPIVENDEELGFLPGDINEKMDPWIRPIMDAVIELVGPKSAKKLFEDEIVEICPLSYMRGRSFKQAFVIADEMSNSTPSQMKNLLTRLGEESKMVVLGDPSQSDLPKGKVNGLSDFLQVYGSYSKETGGLKVVHLSHDDIVRHPLIPMILSIYGENPDQEGTDVNIDFDIEYDNIGKLPENL